MIWCYDLVFQQGYTNDQGPEFESQLMRQLHKLSGVKMSHTTPYHPIGDRQVERLNRTIINMLKNLAREQKSRWYEHLNNYRLYITALEMIVLVFRHITCCLVEVQDYIC